MTQEMLALIMCGGKGERIKDFCSDKAMLKFNNKPLIEHVLIALIASKQFERIYAAASCNSKVTLEFLKNHNYYHSGALEVMETSGLNYSTDLTYALEKLKPAVVLVLPSDMPLVTPEMIKRIVSKWKGDRNCISIVMDKQYATSLGLVPSFRVKQGNKEYFHAGVTIFDTSKMNARKRIKEYYLRLDDERIAFNINTKEDFFLLENSIKRTEDFS
jgi:GTP:adenosylcobinamide-phosphate guanylyltransferase